MAFKTLISTLIIYVTFFVVAWISSQVSVLLACVPPAWFLSLCLAVFIDDAVYAAAKHLPYDFPI